MGLPSPVPQASGAITDTDMAGFLCPSRNETKVSLLVIRGTMEHPEVVHLTCNVVRASRIRHGVRPNYISGNLPTVMKGEEGMVFEDWRECVAHDAHGRRVVFVLPMGFSENVKDNQRRLCLLKSILKPGLYLSTCDIEGIRDAPGLGGLDCSKGFFPNSRADGAKLHFPHRRACIQLEIKDRALLGRLVHPRYAPHDSECEPDCHKGLACFGGSHEESKGWRWNTALYNPL